MRANTEGILNPLPQRYLTAEEGIGGRIKQRPEDFLVDELPLYEPSGEGEHIYLLVESSNVAHLDVIKAIRRAFNVPEGAIGYAGMKDKHAITRQMISVHRHKDPPGVTISDDRIRILWTDRHTNKLKRGHLVGNRFSIRIRDVDPLKAPRVKSMLEQLTRSGIAAYYGPQRFGYRHNNHLLGAAFFREDWTGMLDELLGATGSPFPVYQQERRELFDQGRFREALAMWSGSDRAERAALAALVEGASAHQACLAVGRATWSFWISAFQSAIFNRVLDQRIDLGRLDQLVEGDLAWKHDTRRTFPVTAEELATGELPPRLASLDISPSGPMWGKDMLKAEGEVGHMEREALEATGIAEPAFLACRYVPEGTRRALRERVWSPDVESGVDEHGPYIRVVFELPRGMYATVVLREIMKAADERALEAPAQHSI